MKLPVVRLAATNAKTGLVYDLIPVVEMYPLSGSTAHIREQTGRALLAFADYPEGRSWVFGRKPEDLSPLLLSDAYDWLQLRREAWQAGIVYFYLIMRENHIFGFISVSNFKGQEGELGYHLSPLASGVMSPSVEVVTKHVLKHNPGQVIHAAIDTTNHASERVVQRCGFVRKTESPPHIFVGQCYWVYEGQSTF